MTVDGDPSKVQPVEADLSTLLLKTYHCEVPADLSALTADFLAEGDGIAVLVAEGEQRHGDVVWTLPTECDPWTLQDQLVHLAWNDEAAVLALQDPEAFVGRRPASATGIQAMVDDVVESHRGMGGREVFAWFNASRSEFARVASMHSPSDRIPWFGPDMSVASKVTARLMEAWAHGFDIVAALGAAHQPTDRVAHVVYLGLQALPNAFAAHGLPVPSARVSARVTLPSGRVFTVGSADSVDRVEGDACELALVVTQRRNPADTGLIATGPVATEWLRIAQAFAGPPGTGHAKKVSGI